MGCRPSAAEAEWKPMARTPVLSRSHMLADCPDLSQRHPG